MNRTCRQMIMIGCCATLLLAGCLGKGSDPSRYYVLHEIDEPTERYETTPLKEDKALLQIGPIGLPRYLDRPQIVSLSSENQHTLGEFDRWSEPLQENFSRVLAGNLGKHLATHNIMIYPNRGPALENFYQLKVEVVRFDGKLTGDVVLEARWAVVGRLNRRVMPITRSVYSEPVDGNSYAAYVAALNRTLALLSKEIATKIRTAVDDGQER